MNNPARLLAVYLGAVSAFSLLLFGWDKLMARTGRRRIPDGALWSAALLGGGTGAVLGMRLFHHKTKKGFFRIGLPLLAALQLCLLAWAAIQ